MAEFVNQTFVRALAVIVLYKAHPTESSGFKTLLAAKAGLDPTQAALHILLYDNTPGGLDPGPLPEGVRYESSGKNAGLAPAYNRALYLAQQEQCAWLLILDQDTTLPSDYLSSICRVASEVEADPNIAAIVPRMLDCGKPVAPVFIRFWGVSYAAATCLGTSRREIHATNSATLFRVASLKQIGGFSPYFWLDYLDGYVFHQLYQHGLKIYIARDIQVAHALSLLHGGDLTPERFHNILRAESAYWDLYGTVIQRLSFDARLLLRVGRQRRRGHSSAITQQTWHELKRRMVHSRARRIQQWRHEMEQQLSVLEGTEADPLDGFPVISVCLAVYNGERYIEAQMQSILGQLRAHDEVVVVDDASTDNTKDLIESLRDPRVRLIRHNENSGVVRSFEMAISSASGEILFLSDQDDIWVPDKVLVIMRMFQLHPNAEIAVSDASLIDEEGNPLAPSYFAQLGGFRSGVFQNLAHCHYLGCTMAFRGRLRSKILPFPPGNAVLHDLWIGILNSFLGGETIHTDRPLVYYRRHQGNATGNRRLSLSQQLRIRWGVCSSLAAYWLRQRRATSTKSISTTNQQ